VVNRTLAQVTRYLDDPALHGYAIEQVNKHLTTETRVVIGHSLGSVVAYDTLRARPPDQPVPLLVTLGSPLGLSAISQRLQPQRPGFPAAVRRGSTSPHPTTSWLPAVNYTPSSTATGPTMRCSKTPGTSTTDQNPTRSTSTSPSKAAEPPSLTHLPDPEPLDAHNRRAPFGSDVPRGDHRQSSMPGDRAAASPPVAAALDQAWH